MLLLEETHIITGSENYTPLVIKYFKCLIYLTYIHLIYFNCKFQDFDTNYIRRQVLHSLITNKVSNLILHL